MTDGGLHQAQELRTQTYHCWITLRFGVAIAIRIVKTQDGRIRECNEVQPLGTYCVVAHAPTCLKRCATALKEVDAPASPIEGRMTIERPLRTAV
jgi:hypothetical protein